MYTSEVDEVDGNGSVYEYSRTAAQRAGRAARTYSTVRDEQN